MISLSNRLYLFLAIVVGSFFSFAQNGTIRGTVLEDASGEALFGVTVQIKGTTNGAITDFDGKFEISTPAGTYDLQASFISFQTVTIAGLVVEEGEVTVIDQIRLKEDVELLEEVVITAEVIKTTEAALLTVKRKSANLIDGISSQTFKKIGDNDAASAVTRVPGVSVQGGKYVFVRGLGDRYTKTILNGMEIPGLDPDRNTIQLDIFPTNVIDNIVVLKSFTADLPADFTGGIVNVATKDFPDEKTFNVSFGVAFNPSMHFNNNFTTYEGSSTDLLGFDDGERDLPFPSTTEIPSPNGAPDVDEAALITDLTSRFNPTFGASTETSNMNYNFSISTGDQIKKEKVTLGYNAALSYRNETTFFEDAENSSIWLKNSDDNTVTELEQDRGRVGLEGSNIVTIGTLAGFALKTKSSKFQITGLHIQNGEDVANIYNEINIIRNDNESVRDVLSYSQRSISNVLLSGEHYFDQSKLKIDWKLSPTFSQIQDKDVRLAPFTQSEEGALGIEPSEGGDPIRLWRNLDEVNYSGRLDFTKDLQLNGRDSKLKFGVSNVYKQRDFGIDNFTFVIVNPSTVPLNGDPNNLLIDSNVFEFTDTNDDGRPDLRRGVGVFGNFEASNTFEGSMSNFGAYVSGELQLTDRLKSVVGLRVESFVQRYTGQDQTGERVLDNEKVLDSTKPFPTASFIYSYNETTNFRISYARTIARPSFKEKSIAQIVDPISATTWIGNIDLIESDINNYDIRWERFYPGGQTISVSGFYKTFKNPIEVEVFSAIEPQDFTARNNGDAEVFGAEIEIRKNLGFINPRLEPLFFTLNTSVIESQLQISEAEREGRQGQARDGEVIEDTRPMQGQSRYLINAGLAYNNIQKGLEAGFFYNVQGKALSVVGTGITPDLYTVPFHSLNFSIQKEFGRERDYKLRFRVSNLLNDDVELQYESFGSSDQIATRRSPGQAFSLAVSHQF